MRGIADGEDILRGLYSGKIIPWERNEPRNEVLYELVRKIEDEERYFVQKMSQDDCERFASIVKAVSRIEFVEEENIFFYGFTLGLLLMMDVMKEAEIICNE